MTKRLSQVALASASPRRLSLLQSLNLRVTVIRSAYDERPDASARGGRELALRHAVGKADAAESTGPSMLVAADTVVDVDETILGKPHDAASARAMLRALAGRWHVVHTGYAVVDRDDGRRETGVESSRVRFAPLDDDTIDRYIATGESLDKAGGYGIQGFGALLVERIDGDFYAVMGLPLARIGAACRILGFEIF